MNPAEQPTRVRLDPGDQLWQRCFQVAPLVIVGTRDPDGAPDFAPKHLAMPLSWGPHFGFVCTQRHGTCRNALRNERFTVSFVNPNQIILTSLAAAPRCADDSKPALAALPTVAATQLDGEVLLRDAYLHLECELDRVIDGFGENCLIAGRIVAASVARDALRDNEIDDADLLADAPLLAYLHPGRYAVLGDTLSFPFHEGFSR